MNRRDLNRAALAALVVATHERTLALELSSGEASAGLKAALEKGANAAVALLGKPDGFLGNPRVRIPLPGHLESAAKMLRTLGQGKRVDELVTSINRAAEAAVPMGKDLLLGAVRDMSVSDARKVLQGGQTGVTDFFADKTRAPLSQKLLPVITQATEKVGLAQQYNALAAKASGAGLVKKEDATIEQYVTGKTLNGLYLVIGEEEKKIRQDPVGAGSDLLKKVFGALK